MSSLRTVTRTQGANQALKSGDVTPRAYSFDFVEVTPLIQAFRRMVRDLEFDVCEMAFTTYLCAKAHGKPLTALPIFLVRGLHHGAIARHVDGDIRNPKDLEGRRVGVNRGYTVTTGVWARGILADEYGVNLDDISWVLSGDEHVAEYRPPTNVVPAGADEDLVDLVLRGDLAAAVGVSTDHPGLVPLIPDPEQAGFAALERRGLYPINHLIVVRDEILEQHPDVAADIFAAFVAAKQDYLHQLGAGGIDKPTAGDQFNKRAMKILGDPLPYGIEPNLAMIDKLIDYAVDQHILGRPLPVETLFHPSTWHLAG